MKLCRFYIKEKIYLGGVVCTLCYTHIILLGASPEVDTACIAGDVEHSQALQTRQRHGNAVTLKRKRDRRGS